LTARHAELTGSPRAKWILDNWETMLPKFIKVYPHEYKRVLGVPRTSAALAAAHASSAASTQEALRG
jgi:glutamate synthase domain-containing protein 3